MRATVHLPGPLLPLSEGKGTLSVDTDGSTVADVLSAVFARHPPLRDRLLDEQGDLRRHVNVFVDRHSIRHTGGLQTTVADGAVVSVIPAVSGGATPQRTRKKPRSCGGRSRC